MKNPEDHDPVWELLDRASRPQPSPFFSRNVMREVRKLENPSSWSDRLAGVFRSPVGMTSALAAAALGIFSLVQLSPVSEGTPEIVHAEGVEAGAGDGFEPANELEAVEYLGQLMAVADPGQLSDEVLGDLFF